MTASIRALLRMWRSYRFNSFFLHAFRLILIVVALPLALLLIVTFSYSHVMGQRELQAANMRALDATLNTLGMIAGEAQQAALHISADTDIQGSLRFDNPISFDEYQTATRAVNIMELTKRGMVCSGMTLLNLSSRYAMDTLYGGVRHVTAQDEWINALLAAPLPDQSAPVLWKHGGIQSTYGNGPTVPAVILYRSVRGSQGEQGMLCIYIHDDQIRDLLGGVSAHPQTETVVTDAQGAVVFDTGGRFAGRTLDEVIGTEAADILMGGRGSFAQKLDGIARMVSYAPIAQSAWTCVQIVPYNSGGSSTRTLAFNVLLSLVIGLIVSAVVAFTLALRLYEPIRRILTFLETQPETSVPYPANNELNYILMQLVSVYEENKQLEEAQMQRYTLLRNAQAHALQAQITPHFLHNALAAVQWQVMKETGSEDSPALRMIVALSSMARDTMRDVGNFSTLRDELSYVSDYLFLQKARYGDALVCERSIPDELMPCVVPRMCLQPLLENAITHGISGRGHGRVVIRAERVEADLCLSVKDDGRGMAEDEMAAYNAAFARPSGALTQHIGLKNLNQRVKLLFGEAYGLQLSALPEGGLCVLARFPYMTGNLSE